MKALLPLIVLLFAGDLLYAQNWQSVYESNTDYYGLASTTNGDVFAYKPDTLLRSSSNGDSATWIFFPTPDLTEGYLYAFNNTIFILGQPLGLLRSDDFGASWQSCNKGLGVDSSQPFRLSYLGDSNYILVTKNRGNYYSINNAHTWQKSIGISGSAYCSARAGKNTIAASYNAINLSTNDGATFKKLSPYSENNALSQMYSLNDSSVVLYSPIPLGGVYFITDTTLRRSAAMNGIDSGKSYGQFARSPVQNIYYMATGGAFGLGGNLYYSTDDGDNWTKCDTGLPVLPVIPIYRPNTILVTANNYVYVSLNNGNIYRSNIHTTGIKNIKKYGAVSVYPNPANEYIDIVTPNDQKNVSIAILDMTGSIVIKQIAQTSTSRINISSIPTGCYIVHVSNSEGSATTRFIKY
ncbi:MAG: T9SS type A sorting domain-containing protein [Bacteroidetes bacterium]|nr:T9SS type A sorting domain-containing protein [Bacteroidota bacterium]